MSGGDVRRRTLEIHGGRIDSSSARECLTKRKSALLPTPRIRGFRVYRRRCLPWLSRFLRQNYPAEGISSWSGYWCPADDCFSPGTCRSRRKVCRSSPPSLRRGTPRKPSLNATHVTTKLTQRRGFYSDSTRTRGNLASSAGKTKRKLRDLISLRSD